MRSSAFALVFILTVAGSRSDCLAEAIENDCLRVTVSDGKLRAESVGRDEVVIPEAAFRNAVRAVETEAVEHELWGTGETVRLTHDNKWTTRLTLYERHPFLHLRTTRFCSARRVTSIRG